MVVGDSYVLPGFLMPILTQLFFPKPPTTFLTRFCRGERGKYTGKKSHLNRGSNSQPPSHESDMLTTESPGRGWTFRSWVLNYTNKLWRIPGFRGKKEIHIRQIIHALSLWQHDSVSAVYKTSKFSMSSLSEWLCRSGLFNFLSNIIFLRPV